MPQYNRKFYEELERNRISAESIVPIILRFLPQASDDLRVADVSCGIGHWLSVYKQHGCSVHGFDLPPVDKQLLMIDPSEFTACDLEQPIQSNEKYNLVMCLEVAEHLDATRADTLIDSIANLAGEGVVLFSAAIPYQLGVHHVNMQWPAYWIEKFRARGYMEIDCLRRLLWDNSNALAMYAQNMFFFCKDTPENAALLAHRIDNRPEMYALVHPGIWTDVHNTAWMKLGLKLFNCKPIYWLYRKLSGQP